MLKILITTPSNNDLGGVTFYLRFLALNKEPNIDYLSVSDDNRGASSLQKVLGTVKKYFEFWQTSKHYDAIHLNPSLNPKSYYREMGLIILAKCLGKKTIVTMHGWQNDFEQKLKASAWQSALFRKTYGAVDVYLVLGEVFKQKLKGLGVKTERFYIESTVADDTGLAAIDLKSKTAPKRHWTLLFLSRIEKEKGIFIVLDTLKLLQAQGQNNIKLIVAGDGSDLVAAKQYAIDQGISQVEFPGFVSGDLKQQLLLQSDLLFFPTFYGEGLPTVILEAMLYGLPVISTVNAAIPDVVKDGENGYLLSSGEPKDYLPPILRLLEDKALYQRMVLNNHQQAMENYTAAKVRQRILAIYQGL